MTEYLKPIRIGKDNYKKPTVTNREKLTKDDIINLLENYEEVEDIDNVPLYTHVRYITYKDNKQQFFPGGVIIVKSKKYIILSNEIRDKNINEKGPIKKGRRPITWSVQKYKLDNNGNQFQTIFFRRITEDEQNNNNNIEKANETIDEQNELIDKQQREIVKLKKFIKSLDLDKLKKK